MKRILYVGWLGFNNVGDELMWLLFRDLCRAYLPSKQYDVLPSIPGVDIHNTSPYDTIVLGGGSLLIPGYIDVVYKAVSAKKKVLIWGSGHDRADFPKLDEAGVVRSNLAFTGEHRPNNEKLAEVVEQAVFCGVRGPLTYQFLDHIGNKMEHVMISGDPGMLLPSPSPAPTGGLANERTIGVNWGTAYNRIYGGSESRVEDQLVQALQQLVREGYKVHIFPVWGPDRDACRSLYKKLGDTEKVTMDLELYHHEDLIERIRDYALTINFKLHASYLSAAAGVPFVCLGYRFKSLDFGYSIDLPDYIVPTHDEKLTDTILDRVSRIRQESGSIQECFVEHREKYRALLEIPFREKLL